MIGKTTVALFGCLLAIATALVTAALPAHASGPCYAVCQLQPAAMAVPGSHIATVTRMTNHEELFWVAPDGSVWDTYTYGGGTWGTFRLAPKGSAATCSGWPITAVSRAANTMEVFWIGPDGSVHDAAYYDGAGWTGLGSNPALPLIAYAGDAATGETGESIAGGNYCPGITSVSRASDRLEVLWVANDMTIHDASWWQGYPWQHHAPISGGYASGGVSPFADGGITAISRAGNTIELFWVGFGGLVSQVYHASYYDGADWSSPEILPTSQNTGQVCCPAPPAPYSSLTAVSRRPDTMEVFWVDMNGAIEDAWWYATSGQWQQAARTGPNAMPVKSHLINGFRYTDPAGPSLVAVAPEPKTGNSMMTFFPAGDGSVQDLEWYQGAGSWNQHTVAVSGSNTAKTYNSISALHSALNDTVDVFWIDDDGSIQHAYW